MALQHDIDHHREIITALQHPAQSAVLVVENGDETNELLNPVINVMWAAIERHPTNQVIQVRWLYDSFIVTGHFEPAAVKAVKRRYENGLADWLDGIRIEIPSSSLQIGTHNSPLVVDRGGFATVVEVLVDSRLDEPTGLAEYVREHTVLRS